MTTLIKIFNFGVDSIFGGNFKLLWGPVSNASPPPCRDDKIRPRFMHHRHAYYTYDIALLLHAVHL